MLNSCGGDVIKFAGDALIVLWQPEYTSINNKSTLDLKSMACRAGECALLIQEELHGAELAKDVTFSVKVGISCETATIMHLGGLCNRVEYTACGKALLDAFECESFCKRGETVVSHRAWELMKNSFCGIKLENEIEHDLKIETSKLTTSRKLRHTVLNIHSSRANSIQSVKEKRRSNSLIGSKVNDAPRLKQSAIHGSLTKKDLFELIDDSNPTEQATSSKPAVKKQQRAFVKLTGTKKRMKKKSLRKTFLNSTMEMKALKLYIPGAVKSFVDGFQSSWAADLRTTTVCFVNLKLSVLKALSMKYDVGKQFNKDSYKAVVINCSKAYSKHAFKTVISNILNGNSLSINLFEIFPRAKQTMKKDNALKTILDKVQSTFLLVQQIVYGLEGSVDKFLIDDKGSTLLTVWGLPPLTHFDDSLRGCLFALKLSEKLTQLKLVTILCDILSSESPTLPSHSTLKSLETTLKSRVSVVWFNKFAKLRQTYSSSDPLALIMLSDVVSVLDELDLSYFRSVSCNVGITSGEILSGPVGSGCRKDYSVLGDVVNTSARLMQASAKQNLTRNKQFYGCILCNLAVRRNCSAVDSQLVFEVLQPIKLKGKITPVNVYQPAFSASTLYDRSLIIKKENCWENNFIECVDNVESVKCTKVLECYGQRLDLRIFHIFSHCVHNYRQKHGSGQVATIQVVVLLGGVNSAKSWFINSFISQIERKCKAIALRYNFMQHANNICLASKDVGVRVWIIESNASLEHFIKISESFTWKNILNKLIWLIVKRQGKSALANLKVSPDLVFQVTQSIICLFLYFRCLG